MLDQNDLLAIAQLMDQKLAEQEKRIMDQMEQRFSKVDQRFSEIDQKFIDQEKRIIDQVNQRFIDQEKRIINQVNAIIETTVMPDIKKIAEGHHDILQRLPDIEEQAELKSRVKVLERVTMEMRVDIDELKKAT